MALTSALVLLTSCSGAPEDAALGRGAEAPSAVDQKAAPTSSFSGPAELVVHAAGRTFVVLPQEVTDLRSAGAATLVAYADDVATVTKQIDPASFPTYLAAQRARPVTVVSDSGARCVARVADIVLLAQVSPDFELSARISGKPADPDGPVTAPMAPQDLAEEAYRLGENGAHLALALDLDRESCTGAHFALVSGDAESARPLPANDAATETVTLAFRALPEFEEHAKEYAERLSQRDPGADKENGFVPAASWDTYGQAAPSVRRFALGDESLLFVSAGGDEGCGGFNAQLSALFRETENGPVLVRAWNGFAHEPLAIVTDATGYEVIFQDVRGHTKDPDLANAEPQYFGCRC